LLLNIALVDPNAVVAKCASWSQGAGFALAPCGHRPTRR